MPHQIERNAAYIAARSIPEPNSGCWLWTGDVARDGYGKMKFRGRCSSASRVSFILHRGEIEPGLEVDHICHTPACVNPDHLRAVSRSENCKRRASNAYGNGVCQRGHLLLGRDRHGRSYCKECQKAASRRYRARLRQSKGEG